MGPRGTCVSQLPSPPSWVGMWWREDVTEWQRQRPWVLSSLLGVTLGGSHPFPEPQFPPILKANLVLWGWEDSVGLEKGQS